MGDGRASVFVRHGVVMEHFTETLSFDFFAVQRVPSPSSAEPVVNINDSSLQPNDGAFFRSAASRVSTLGVCGPLPESPEGSGGS
jgi:hypothetical protein